MSPGDFFVLSGVIAWGWVIVRVIQTLQGIGRRMSWAVSGWKRPRPTDLPPFFGPPVI